MKPFIAAIVAALSGLALMPAQADSFVAAGQPLPSPAPFQVLADKQEVLAPAVEALRRLGVQVSASDNRVEMHAPNGSVVIGRIGSDRAIIAGAERPLPAAISRRGPDLYLPVRAIAWNLGLAYRWDEKSRTIFLHPRIADITCERLPDKVRVKITGSAPLSYSAGLLKAPARIYVDIANADLFAAEQQIAVNEGDLVTIRASQNSLNPDLVRVVLDLKQEPVEYYHSAAAGGRTIVVDIPAPRMEAPATEGTVTVSAVRLERRSDAVCALVVQANGNLVAGLSTTQNPAQVILDLSNAQLASEEVEGSHPLVQSASAEQTGESRARIVLDLGEPQPAALARRPRGVCVLVGRVPLSDVTVVLDAGHGGRQTGVPGRSGLMEKEVNLEVALRAEKLLKERGARVILTRRDDSSLAPITRREELRPELVMRAQIANEQRADLFVSIHCNSSPRNSVPRTGSETYYTTSRSLGLAKVMQQELVGKLKRKDGGVHTCNFVVTRESRVPAVLLELAYLNNTKEEALLGSPEFRQQAAQAIADGVERFAGEGGLLDYYAELESAKVGVAVAKGAQEQPPAPAPAPDKAKAGASTAPDATSPGATSRQRRASLQKFTRPWRVARPPSARSIEPALSLSKGPRAQDAIPAPPKDSSAAADHAPSTSPAPSPQEPK
jgi:N-acetylmuramoyl-L-alanine amidase